MTDSILDKINSNKIKFHLSIVDDSGIFKYSLAALNLEPPVLGKLEMRFAEEQIEIQNVTQEKEIEVIHTLINLVYNKILKDGFDNPTFNK